jgi:hypothetical protein
MMNITANIPDALYQQIEALSKRENISIEQLVTIALSAQVSAWATKDYIEDWWAFFTQLRCRKHYISNER